MMKTWIAAFILFCWSSTGSAAKNMLPCPLPIDKIHETYANAKPFADERTLACKDSPVAPDGLNECGVKAYLLAMSADFVDLMKDGMYSAKYIGGKLQLATDEVRFDPSGEAKIVDVCDYVARRNGAARDPKDVKLLGDNWSFTRKLTDANDPRSTGAGSAQVPFVATLQQDREKNKTTSTVYGTIAYNISHSEEHALSAQMIVDSTTADPASKSSVALQVPYTKYFLGPTPIFNDVTLSVTPQYQTDRDFARKAYQLTGSATFSSETIARAGLYTCWPSIDCEAPSEYFRFLWTPSLGLDAGRVDDAAGNANLAVVQKEGTYYRLVPSVTMELKPTALSTNLTFQLTYRHRYDLREGWDRGYGEANVLYALNKNFFLTAIYRKGRKDVTFDPVNTLLLGFGYAQQPQ